MAIQNALLKSQTSARIPVKTSQILEERDIHVRLYMRAPESRQQECAPQLRRSTPASIRPFRFDPQREMLQAEWLHSLRHVFCREPKHDNGVGATL
jgi:hypothetical protein